jgi:hypothetical protein
VQLAGGKLQDQLLHSLSADDRRDLKRDIEYGLRDGLYIEPTRVSDKLLSIILTNWKITPSVSASPSGTMPEPRRFPPPWSVDAFSRLRRRSAGSLPQRGSCIAVTRIPVTAGAVVAIGVA